VAEQAVSAYNAAQPPIRLAALYIEPAPKQLDYPFAVMPGLSQAQQSAAAALRAGLAGAAFRDRLATIGVRAADGSKGAGFQAPDGAPDTTKSAAVLPPGATIDRLLTVWIALTLPARTLNVIDVSGSMLEPVPTAGNRTRMEITIDAARRGFALFDDTWASGLWIFSTNLDGDKDYKQLVPIAPLSTSRAQHAAALNTIQAIRNGDTGLYDTILAGYKVMVDGYDPGRVNSLIVLTDGINDDPKGGLTLDQLLAELKKVMDPKKPVQVLLIGMGTDVSKPTMEQVTNTTGGATFITLDPAKIGEVFLKAVALRLQAGTPAK
jgi:hypothetical protein